ncbi:TetR/AcrR family transcriptional regulator [Ureibacillus sp. MALMAid1270]|uniref:TetR/AcrR family transcriptional regulator n=1 Tax=Ureibacillus sp. MALMAid1270 TaxID=3411629 RepID=UPI003BA6CFA4
MARVGLDKTKIIQTAVEIVDNEGVEAVTLAAIARKLSVKPPSLFNHIDGLPSIKRELSLFGLNILFEKLSIATANKKKDIAILAMAKAYKEFSQEHPGLYELTIHAPEKSDHELNIVSSKIIELIMKVLQDYNLEEDKMIHTIRGLRSILHGFASLEQKGAFGIPISIEESFEFMINSFISVLKQRS